MRKLLPTNAFMFFSAVLLVFLFGLYIAVFWRKTFTYRDEVIAENVAQLADIFKKIDEQCGIIDFEYQKNYIDFLTVESFVGSEIGSMNLKYPKHWQGPYLDDNPTMQEKYYQIVRTTKGYFIVPGEGVRLANGKVIGQNIVLTENTDIEALVHEGELKVNSRALAARISVSGK